jgi:hypothetical protein
LFVFAIALIGCDSGSTSNSTIAFDGTSSTAPPTPTTTSFDTSTSTTSIEPPTTTSPEVAPGWTFAEIPFTVREGSAYAVGDRWFFAWGGAPDRSGALMADGVLVDIDTGDWVVIPTAPIGGRYLSTAVWTGREFIVFGGHSFHESFVDGAAFDPVTLEWRPIADAPLSPAAFPSGVWMETEMVVWVPGNDSEFASLPQVGVGQMAAYDPAGDTWRNLDGPQHPVMDASLLATINGLNLVGGPTTRDLGSGGSAVAVIVFRFDPATGGWEESEEGTTAESVRPFELSNGDIGVLADDGSVNEWDGTEWILITQFIEDCWYDIGAASTDGFVFLKNCGSYQLDGTATNLVLESGAYGATTNLYGSGFLATNAGELVTLTDSDPSEGTGPAIFGVYDGSG